MGVQILRQPPSGETPINTIIKSEVETAIPWGLLRQRGIRAKQKQTVNQQNIL